MSYHNHIKLYENINFHIKLILISNAISLHKVTKEYKRI